MAHPKAVGDRTTLATMLALHAAGYTVYLPFGENTRCDLIIDDGSRLARVQCKTGRLREGAVEFRLCSSYAHHRHPRVVRRNYVGDIDYFAVHCLETSGVYLVPIGDVPTMMAKLRVEPPRNSQKKKIRDARLYEIGRVAFDGVRQEGPVLAGVMSSPNA